MRDWHDKSKNLIFDNYFLNLNISITVHTQSSNFVSIFFIPIQREPCLRIFIHVLDVILYPKSGNVLQKFGGGGIFLR